MIRVLGRERYKTVGEFQSKFWSMHRSVSGGIRTGLGVVPGTSGGLRGIKVASGGLWLQVDRGEWLQAMRGPK